MEIQGGGEMNRINLLLSLILLLGACAEMNQNAFQSHGLTSKMQKDSAYFFPDFDFKNFKEFGFNTFRSQPLIRVTDVFGLPVPKARILIGNALNTPFDGNYFTTNDQGEAEVPEGWTMNATITADSAGYVRVSYLNLTPGPITLIMQPDLNIRRAELSGKTTGFRIVNGDKLIDFGLTLKAMTYEDLLSFDLNLVLSPYKDVVTAGGYDIYLPSNVSLPSQKESYGIFPVSLNKNQYRLYFSPSTAKQKLMTTNGRFPFKKVVDGYRAGKPMYELLDHFSLTGGTFSDVVINSTKHSLDVPVESFTFKDKRNIQAQKYSAEDVLFSLAVHKQDGFLVPTDIKRSLSSSLTPLNIYNPIQAYYLGVLKKTKEMDPLTPGEEKTSVVFLPFQERLQAQFLPFIPAPTISGQNKLNLPIPQNQMGISELGIYSILSQGRKVKLPSGEESIVYDKNWEIYGEGWVQSITLPQWPLVKTNFSGKKWEITFIGSQKTKIFNYGPSILEAATHVTHSSTIY